MDNTTDSAAILPESNPCFHHLLMVQLWESHLTCLRVPQICHLRSRDHHSPHFIGLLRGFKKVTVVRGLEGFLGPSKYSVNNIYPSSRKHREEGGWPLGPRCDLEQRAWHICCSTQTLAGPQRSDLGARVWWQMASIWGISLNINRPKSNNIPSFSNFQKTFF